MPDKYKEQPDSQSKNGPKNHKQKMNSMHL